MKSSWDDDRFDVTDPFWDLTEKVEKRPTAPSGQFASRIPLTDVKGKEIPGHTNPAYAGKLTFPDANVTRETYHPSDNKFVTSVTVSARWDAGTFYRQFLTDAQKLLSLVANETEYTPFYSYMPQYSQMSGVQLSYYLYWRGQLKAGVYLKTDETYLLLYVYELLNLGGSLIDAGEALERLASLWCAYGPKFPRLNKYFALWLSDFAMIHKIAVPRGILYPIMKSVLDASDLKEFYLGTFDDVTVSNVELLLALLSDYDWHTSRYAKGESAEAYQKHIPASLLGVFRLFFEEGKLPLCSNEQVTVRHTAYCGAIWAHDTKYTLEVTYYPFSDVGELRSLITNGVKYSENKLRASMGLRSRLAVGELDEETVRQIDSYYRVMCPPAPKAVEKKTEPLYYEVLYDAPDRGIRFDKAEEIEEASWDNTRRLVTEEEWGEIAEPALEYPKENVDFAEDAQGGFCEEKAFLLAVLEDKTAPYDPMAQDRLAEQINAYFLESMGDVVLELGDRGYTVVPDYTDEVMQWIHK